MFDEAWTDSRYVLELRVQDQCSLSFIDVGRKRPAQNRGNLACAVDGLRSDIAHSQINYLEFKSTLQLAGGPPGFDEPDKNLFDLFKDDETALLEPLFASIVFLCNGSLEEKLDFCWELFSNGRDSLDLHIVSELMHCVLWSSGPVTQFPDDHRSIGRPGLGALLKMDVSRKGVAELANDMFDQSPSNRISRSDFCRYFTTEPFLRVWLDSMQRRVHWHRWQRDHGRAHVESATRL